uniref:Uncharacterized protein n=1 Tax=Carassius gibelio TaxID=101364 RepID=Q98U01_CARGB|nr:unknown [Carassius gibelio]
MYLGGHLFWPRFSSQGTMPRGPGPSMQTLPPGPTQAMPGPRQGMAVPRMMQDPAQPMQGIRPASFG